MTWTDLLKAPKTLTTDTTCKCCGQTIKAGTMIQTPRKELDKVKEAILHAIDKVSNEGGLVTTGRVRNHVNDNTPYQYSPGRFSQLLTMLIDENRIKRTKVKTNTKPFHAIILERSDKGDTSIPPNDAYPLL